MRFHDTNKQSSAVRDGETDSVQIRFSRHAWYRARKWRRQEDSIPKPAGFAIALGVGRNPDCSFQHSGQHVGCAYDEDSLRVGPAQKVFKTGPMLLICCPDA